MTLFDWNEYNPMYQSRITQKNFHPEKFGKSSQDQLLVEVTLLKKLVQQIKNYNLISYCFEVVYILYIEHIFNLKYIN